MSSTQASSAAATATSGAATVPMRLEVVVIPVADVDRAKSFYEGLGWRLDADAGGGDYRVVQLTPPASNASIIFGMGVTSDQPGSLDGLMLVVDDIAAARDELVAHGADVSEVFHDAGGGLGGGFHPGTRRGAHRGRIPRAGPMAPTHRSAIPTATSGCCRRSRSGCPVGCGRDHGRRGPRRAAARDG
jgi:catechol 2,3-dioxygenase-like lactoylglutathione lyase family enzyme